MNISKLLTIVCCFSLIYSCTSDTKTNSTASKNDIEKVAPAEKINIDFKTLYGIANQESLEIYNGREQQILANPNASKLGPDSIVKALLGIIEEGVKRKIFYGSKHGLVGEKDIQYFIVLEDNLPDDSIKSDIRFFEMRKGEKSWNLAAVSSVWKCYTGRGHQDYSTEMCN